MASALELAQHQGSPLAIGQGSDRADRLLQSLPSLEALRRLLDPVDSILVERELIGRSPQLLEGGVDRDPIEPRLESAPAAPFRRSA